MRTLFSIFVFSLLVSCSGDDDNINGIACTEEYRYGITVNLYDSVTSEPLSVCETTYKIVEGTYVEENEFLSGLPCEELTYIAGAGERAGIYDIEISKSGYELWESSGVVVKGGECHVESVAIDAFLAPQK